MSLPNTLLQTTCTTPLRDMLTNDTFAWLPCPYALHGPGVLGVGMIVWFTVFVGMANWSESFRLPIAWTALFATVIFSFLPGTIANRLMGVLTLGVAIVLFMLWQYWRS